VSDNAQRIKALPGTFEAMYEIAKVYGTTSKPNPSTSSGSGTHVFMTSDQLIPAKQSANADGKKQQPEPGQRGPNWERNKEKRDSQKAVKAAASAVASKPNGTAADKQQGETSQLTHLKDDGRRQGRRVHRPLSLSAVQQLRAQFAGATEVRRR